MTRKNICHFEGPYCPILQNKKQFLHKFYTTGEGKKACSQEQHY